MAPEIQLALSLALGLVFACSASSKLAAPRRFLHGVVEYRVLPSSISSFVGALLIPVEAALAVCHVSGRGLSIAVPAAIAVLFAFVIAAGAQLARGRQSPCYCFDVTGEELVSGRTLARLSLLLAAEALLLARVLRARNVATTVAAPALHDWVTAFVWANVVLAAARWAIDAGDIRALARLTLRSGARTDKSAFQNDSSAAL